MNNSQRLHALDNLRAIMMWLGIVLHASLIYISGKSTFPYHDRRSSVVADLLLLFIHSFRIPVFFILAGFFVAMLARRHGYQGMMKNRLRRIALPFVIFWPPLFFVTVVLIMLFAHLVARGSIGIDPNLMPKDPSKPIFNTMHLWFLYYLFWFCAATALIGYVGNSLSEHIKNQIAGLWKHIGSAWWGFLVLSVPVSVIGFFHPAGILPASGSFIVQFDEFIHNGLFFVFGWYLHQNQGTVLFHYSKYCWRYLVSGLSFFLLYLIVLGPFKDRLEDIPMAAMAWLPFAYGSASWLLGFSLIGMFSRYFQVRNTALEYIARSSYWVYLIHFPCTIGFGAILYNVDVSALVKMMLNILATTVTCLLTYHVLVRHSLIGTLLNGRPMADKVTTIIDQASSVAHP